MSWNINDWDTEEDKRWELTEEDTDDEFDDIALARLGVDLPECAREPVRIQAPVGTGVDMTGVMNEWSRMMQNSDLAPELRAAMESITTPDGTLHFGDEPPQSQGIDPEVAGFDMTREDFEPPDQPAEPEEDDEEGEDTCPECGYDHYECECDDEDNDTCYECGSLYHDCMCFEDRLDGT